MKKKFFIIFGTTFLVTFITMAANMTSPKVATAKETFSKVHKSSGDSSAGIENNFKESSPADNINVNNMKIIASIPKEKIYLYASNKHNKDNMYKGLVLGIQGTNKSFDWETISCIEDLPKLYYIDLNHDQKKELAIMLSKGHGTGSVNDRIHIINPNNFTEYKVEDTQSIIKNHVKTKILSEKQVKLTIDNKESYVDTRKFPLYEKELYPTKITKITYGDDFTDYYVYHNTIKGSLGAEGDYLRYIGNINFDYTFKDNQFKASHIHFEIFN